MSETEVENDEESQQFEKQIDWDSLLNAANDPDFTEFLQSPVDDAINILKCCNLKLFFFDLFLSE